MVPRRRRKSTRTSPMRCGCKASRFKPRGRAPSFGRARRGGGSAVAPPVQRRCGDEQLVGVPPLAGTLARARVRWVPLSWCLSSGRSCYMCYTWGQSSPWTEACAISGGAGLNLEKRAKTCPITQYRPTPVHIVFTEIGLLVEASCTWRRLCHPKVAEGLLTMRPSTLPQAIPASPPGFQSYPKVSHTVPTVWPRSCSGS